MVFVRRLAVVFAIFGAVGVFAPHTLAAPQGTTTSTEDARVSQCTRTYSQCRLRCDRVFDAVDRQRACYTRCYNDYIRCRGPRPAPQ